MLEVGTCNGEIVLKYVTGDGVVILSHPMIPDEARDLVNHLGEAVKSVAAEEAWAS